jgi:hypothetical protein
MATYKKVVVESENAKISQEAASATVLRTARDFSISGDGVASAVSFNGSGAVALALSLADNVVANDEIASASITANLFRDKNDGTLGNGTNGQFLKSEGDGTLGWGTAPTPENSTITITAGVGLEGTDNFTLDQSSNKNITLSIDENIASTGLTYNNSTGELSVDASQAITTISGNLSINGNLTVDGTTFSTATETLEIADNKMLLNSDLTGSTAVDTGIVANRADATGDKFKHLFWDESLGAWATGSDDSSSNFPSASNALMVNVNKAGAPGSSDTEAPVGGMVYDTSGNDMYIRTA